MEPSNLYYLEHYCEFDPNALQNNGVQIHDMTQDSGREQHVEDIHMGYCPGSLGADTTANHGRRSILKFTFHLHASNATGVGDNVSWILTS